MAYKLRFDYDESLSPSRLIMNNSPEPGYWRRDNATQQQRRDQMRAKIRRLPRKKLVPPRILGKSAE